MKSILLAAAFIFAIPAFASAAEEGRICPMIYQPVCAAKPVQCIAAPCYPVYQTYGNSCVAGGEDATVIHQGECTTDETGPVKDAPTSPAEPSPAYVPPANCIAWFDGCNSCAKSADGAAACTLMACMGPSKAGYCTKYSSAIPSTPAKPITGGTVTSSTSVSVIASTTVASASSSPASTTTAPQHEGFLLRFWHSILNWFR